MKEDSLVRNLAQFQENLFIFMEAEYSRDVMIKAGVAVEENLLGSTQWLSSGKLKSLSPIDGVGPPD